RTRPNSNRTLLNIYLLNPDGETRRRRRGEGRTGRQGDWETGDASDALSASHTRLPLPISSSPRLPVATSPRPSFCLALERLQHVEQSAALGLAREDARAAFVQRAQGAVESLVADLAREADRDRVVARRRLEVFKR